MIYIHEKTYIKRLRSAYGLTLEEYYSMLKAQDFLCGICKKSADECRLFVDHCHNTGKIRGLLCNRCNCSLAHYDDNIEKIKEARRPNHMYFVKDGAIAYLSSHS